MVPANVLIAEDEAPIRLDLRRLLAEIGHNIVAEADTGEKTLALARSLRPDAVLLDLRMPRTDSIEVARTLTRERVAPVLVLTSPSEAAAAIQQASDAGVLAFLSKPCQRPDLECAIPVAIARFQEIVTLENTVRALEERMEARKLVGRAKAILMERQALSEREAFHRIQAQSQVLNRPVHEIARAIITASEITS